MKHYALVELNTKKNGWDSMASLKIHGVFECHHKAEVEWKRVFTKQTEGEFKSGIDLNIVETQVVTGRIGLTKEQLRCNLKSKRSSERLWGWLPTLMRQPLNRKPKGGTNASNIIP